MEKQLEIIDKLNIRTFKNVYNFDIYQNNFVDGLLVVDDNYLYVIIDSQIKNKYLLNDIISLDVESTYSGGHLLVNNQEIVASFTNKFQQEMKSLSMSFNNFKTFTNEDYVCPKCHNLYVKGTKYCKYCDSKRGFIRYFLPFMFKYKFIIIFGWVLALLASLLEIYRPQVLQDLVDNFLINKTFNELFVKTIIILGGVYLFTNVINVIQGIVSPIAQEGIRNDIRIKIYDKIQRLSLTDINNKSTGNLINYVSEDSNNISYFFSSYLINFIISIIKLCVVLVIMFISNYILALIVVLTLPIIVLLMARLRHKIKEKYQKNWKYLSKANNTLHGTLQGIKVVKSYSSEQTEINKFAKYNTLLKDSSMKVELYYQTFRSVIMFVIVLVSIFIYYYLSKQILDVNSPVSIGMLLKWTIYYGLLVNSFDTIIAYNQVYSRAMISAIKVKDILETKEESQNENKVDSLKGTIIFDSVSFSYNKQKNVLKKVSFEIKPGEKIGIVGFSGSGKTTLVNLLMKLYKPDNGKIYIDGKDIEQYDDISYRKKIGFVMQETRLFAGTILENLKYGNEDATFEQVLEISKQVSAHDFIINKPFAYQTRLGKNGEGLSKGQQQRIAIARAMLINPSIYIFDEATSSLDSITESSIQESIDLISKNTTTFMIAHRLSTLKNVDRLLVFNDGVLVEVGSHKQLIESKGYYYSLVQAQLSNYEKSKY